MLRVVVVSLLLRERPPVPLSILRSSLRRVFSIKSTRWIKARNREECLRTSLLFYFRMKLILLAKAVHFAKLPDSCRKPDI